MQNVPPISIHCSFKIQDHNLFKILKNFVDDFVVYAKKKIVYLEWQPRLNRFCIWMAYSMNTGKDTNPFIWIFNSISILEDIYDVVASCIMFFVVFIASFWNFRRNFTEWGVECRKSELTWSEPPKKLRKRQSMKIFP